MEITKVGIVGAGVMGSGIAQRCAMRGFQTVVVDVSTDKIINSQGIIHRSLRKLVDGGAIKNDERQGALSKLEFYTKLYRVADCGMVIESVSEDLDLKQKVFSELDELCVPETILASNTSSLRISLLAAATKNPGRVVGMHFMNPAPVIDLVEFIRCESTSNEVAAVSRQFAMDVGCAIVESRDIPGFIVNRILIPMLNEALYLLEADAASAEDIDRAMVLGTKQPVGPLALADRIGLDVILSILSSWHKELQDDRYKPCPLLKRYVQKHQLGRKTGKGIFAYPDA
ncbi:MAG: 3-hydroxybutyryl-CoA dehydrogenase [Nitrospinae bacterium]|nr:3-hydroxybutyryl-CoA dehydrogenase [Nitrospinota bacterium]